MSTHLENNFTIELQQKNKRKNALQNDSNFTKSVFLALREPAKKYKLIIVYKTYHGLNSKKSI